jgi:hypothetical protein
LSLGPVLVSLEDLYSYELYRQNGEQDDDEDMEKEEFAPRGVGVFPAFGLLRAPASVTTEEVHLPLS